MGPLDGLTFEIVGGFTYVYPPVDVTEPPDVVTTTFWAPALPAGVVAVIDVAVVAETVAAAPPIVTVPPDKSVPAIVIGVPPAVVPVFGVIDVMVGNGGIS
jgi:hypothetical protein